MSKDGSQLPWHTVLLPQLIERKIFYMLVEGKSILSFRPPSVKFVYVPLAYKIHIKYHM